MRSISEQRLRDSYRILGEELGEAGIDIEEVKEKVKGFEVEVPSWVFGAFGGGRFGAYMPPGPARDLKGKLRDAAMVHKLTGAAPRVAIHTAWDQPEGVAFADIRPEHFAESRQYALDQGIDFGAVNPTLFREGTHYGSLSSPMPKVRKLMIQHCIVSCQIAAQYAHGLVTYWLTDGTNYPGQRDLWGQEKLIRDAMVEIAEAAPPEVLHLIEYKLFEPGTYSTAIPDWGTSLEIAELLGGRGGVLVDMGHHAWGVNVAQIVARLIGTGRHGGFHFNTRYAADDDHAVEPNLAMYAIFCELVKGGVVCAKDPARNWAYMIDQCSSLENRIHAVLHSIDSLQLSLAKALILDREALAECQKKQDIILANRVFLEAFLTDVRPILRMARIEKGLAPDPVIAYEKSGYQKKIERERG
jgi:L-rhamnose isomerase/sugar isomerase